MLLVILASCNGNKTELTPSVDTTSQTSAPADESVQGTIDDPVVLSRGFIEYDESLLGEAENTVLFFHAPYCGSCTQTDKNLKESWVSNGANVLKLDYDTNQELAKKYWVTKYHTFVQVDADGEMIKKWSWSLTDEDIQQELNSGESMIQQQETDNQELMDDSDNIIEKQTQEVMQKEEDTMMQEKAQENSEVENTELNSGTYANYDSSLVGQSDNTVLFFHASWCPSCVAADKGINAWEVPENLSILKTDFDSSVELRKKYGVTAQHTFVQVDLSWEMIKKWVWGTSVEDIVERVQ